jgi:hypothetical protein
VFIVTLHLEAIWSDMVTDSAKDHVMSAVDPLYNTAVEDQMPLAQ